MSTSIDNLILAKLYELDEKIERLEDSVERSLIKQEKVLNERIRQLNAIGIRNTKHIQSLKRMLRLERKTSQEFYVKNPPEGPSQTKLKEALLEDQLATKKLSEELTKKLSPVLGKESAEFNKLLNTAIEQSKARDAMHKET